MKKDSSFCKTIFSNCAFILINLLLVQQIKHKYSKKVNIAPTFEKIDVVKDI
jgi:hypothetical protein